MKVSMASDSHMDSHANYDVIAVHLFKCVFNIQ